MFASDLFTQSWSVIHNFFFFYRTQLHSYKILTDIHTVEKWKKNRGMKYCKELVQCLTELKGIQVCYY